MERTPDDVLTRPGLKLAERSSCPRLTGFFLDLERVILPTDNKSRIAAGATVKRHATSPAQGVMPGAPDEILIALGNEFDVLSAELTALQKGNNATPSCTAALDEQLNGGTWLPTSVERIEAILALLDPIERAIMATPAVTVVGLGVKARHAAHVLSHYWIDPVDTLDWDARVVRLLIESIGAVAGKALTDSGDRPGDGRQLDQVVRSPTG